MEATKTKTQEDLQYWVALKVKQDNSVKGSLYIENHHGEKQVRMFGL